MENKINVKCVRCGQQKLTTEFPILCEDCVMEETYPEMTNLEYEMFNLEMVTEQEAEENILSQNCEVC